MKSFVTGGAGFLGAAVVRRLVGRGDEVVGLARSDEAATALTRLGAVPVRGDITDARTLDQLLTGVDLVFHVAGDYRIGIRESQHEAMFRTNVLGTTIVLDADVSNGCGAFGGVVGRLTGTGPNLHEIGRASKDVTYWASSAKAERELGYAPRGLEQGLRDLLAAR